MIFFNKMHGTANDFILIDCIKQQFRYSYNILAKFLCDRNLGIGADGVIFIFKSTMADYKMRIFNQDGTEASMCGNGIRCMSKYIYENIEKKECLNIETISGIKKVYINIENNKIKNISVNIGKVILEKNKIPVYLPYNKANEKINNLKINLDGREFKFFFVSVGNPHAICFVEDVNKVDVKKYGYIVENYKFFPNRTNVEFVQVIDEKNIKVRVWERGVGETLSCGTGASSSAYIAIKHLKLNNNLNVELKGGNLNIHIDENDDIILTGPAENVFEGKIDL